MKNELLRQDTLKLVALDRAMRKARSFAAAVRTRIEFYVFALRNGHVSYLNGLADEYAPNSMLSERSLDRVFEDGEVSTEVCRQLVLLAGKDPSLADLLRRDMGDNFLTKHADTGLFAATATA